MSLTTASADVAMRAYRMHPLLDPLLPRRQRSALRFWLPVYRKLRTAPLASDELLRRFVTTATGLPQSPVQRVEQYFEDADRYVDDLLHVVPTTVAESLRLLPETRRMGDLATLLEGMFRDATLRVRYEAQRKLCLIMLLFDIDHTRGVRDGPRHRAIFEQLLEQTIWADLECDDEKEFARDRSIWCFRVRRIRPLPCDSPVEVYAHRTRFKREVDVGPRDAGGGRFSLGETARWPALGRRSGSILSKMIRRGIGDAHQVQDLLGAMFIVGDRRQAYALERRLVIALGEPFRWRDRIDALTSDDDRWRLNPASSPAFRVLKHTVDLLVEDRSASSPYLFPVEIQIHPLESYLETLSGTHLASHQAYKRRQFVKELMPILFPTEVFGSHSELDLHRPDEP